MHQLTFKWLVEHKLFSLFYCTPNANSKANCSLIVNLQRTELKTTEWIRTFHLSFFFLKHNLNLLIKCGYLRGLLFEVHNLVSFSMYDNGL